MTNKEIIKMSKAGGRRPSMPSPKIMINRKKQANRNACRKGRYYE